MPCVTAGVVVDDGVVVVVVLLQGGKGPPWMSPLRSPQLVSAKTAAKASIDVTTEDRPRGARRAKLA
jgi:hypothetical protein